MSLKTWEKKGKRGITRAMSFALRARGTPPMPDLRDLGAILLVRHHNQLGDMLLSTPVFRAVRERAPSARIDLVAGPENVDAVRRNPHLDEVLLYDKAAYLRRPMDGKRFLDRLRGARYDLAIVVSTVAFSHTSAWIAALSGARCRLGRPGPGGRESDTAEELYHRVLPAPTEGRHQTGVNLDLVAPLGAIASDWRPVISLEREEERTGRELLRASLAANGPGLRVVIHPGAGKLPNRWPAERFGEVASALIARGHQVATAAGPGESSLLHRVDRGAGQVLRRIPPCRVRVLGAVLQEADLVLANDTGVLHLGAAVGTPVLALFGPTDPAIWCPAAPAVRWLRAPGEDLDRLSTSVVEQAAVGLADALAGGGAMPSELAAAPEGAP
jgi:ADP-heptose:LPS heptosyltransferase